MPKLLMLIPEDSGQVPHNDNHLLIPQLFRDASWQVETCSQETIHMQAGKVFADQFALGNFDLIWHLGLGNRETFLDRMHMLANHPEKNFVTQPRALRDLHSKLWFQDFGPETYVFNQYDQIAAVLALPGQWVIKPTAASFADDVIFLDTPATDARWIVERETKHGRHYRLLQRVIEQAATGETRCLIAAGEIIGCYRRTCQDSQAHKVHSLGKGAKADTWSLTQQERTLASKIATQLNSLGVGFAAIDLAEPFLMEVNIANPGGLATLAGLGDLSTQERLVDAISQLCTP